MAWREANFSIWIWNHTHWTSIFNTQEEKKMCKPPATPCENNCIPVKKQFILKKLSIFSACDDTWCSFSWTTGIRVSSSVHWVSMRARSDRSTTVSTFFRRSSWLPSVTTELFRLDFPSTSFENSYEGQFKESLQDYYNNIKSIMFGWAASPHRNRSLVELLTHVWPLVPNILLKLPPSDALASEHYLYI